MKFIIPKALKPAGRTPDRVRQLETQTRLKRKGGQRKAFNLPPEAVSDITTIRGKHADLTTDTAAVIAALHFYARKRVT